MSRPKRKILVVDDHPLVRRGVRETIEADSDYEVCAEAKDAAEAMKHIAAAAPDLVVLDLSLGGESGLSVIPQIREQAPSTKILVLSMHDESLYAERVMRSGADGYLHKQEPGDRLLDAIRTILGGHIFLSQPMTDRLLKRAIRPAASSSLGVDTLSDRELEIFELIGRGLTTQQIARQLHRSVKTIETHREHIKEKLGVNTGMELVRLATVWVAGPSALPRRDSGGD